MANTPGDKSCPEVNAETAGAVEPKPDMDPARRRALAVLAASAPAMAVLLAPSSTRASGSGPGGGTSGDDVF